MTFLREEGYYFEQRNPYCKTPLLNQAYRSNPTTFKTCRLLLEHGANVHATNDNGNSVLHLALRGSEDEKQLGILTRKLSMFIKAGADVNCLNKWRISPSFVARKHGGWDEWCMALEANGLDINEVERIDAELGAKQWTN